MKKVLQLTLTATFLFIGLMMFAQPNVLDPNDPDVTFSSSNRPPAPTYNIISKWGHTPRLNWNSSSFKSYYYKGMVFRLKFPKTYSTTADGKKYPLYLFLHGLGEKGDLYDNEWSMYHGGNFFRDKVDNGTFDGFLLYPQSTNGYWTNYPQLVSEVLDSLVKYVKVDIDRMIVDGLSAGGQGVWNFIINRPKYFAAATPISAASLDFRSTNYITIPIWNAQGGQDGNPAPATTQELIDYIRQQGGNIKQSYYPDQGHGVWTSFWNEPGLFDFYNTAHKANPLVYFGRSEFCPGDPINVKLGVQPGFAQYEWSKDNNTIGGATSNTITVTTLGTYRARFKRTTTSAWSEWSPVPAVIKIKSVTQSPPITTDGLKSIVLPSTDGATTVKLMVPNNYTSYVWKRVSDNTTVGTTNSINAGVGQYTVTVTEQYGCSSLPSEVFTVVDANGANKPDPAANLLVTSLSKTSLRLDWSNNPTPQHNESNFEVYQATQAGGPYTFIGMTAADVLSMTVNDLKAGTTYYYKVRAITATSAAAASNEASGVTGKDTQAPAAPTNLSIVGSNRTSISLSWTAASDDVGIAKYEIFVNGVKSYSTTGTTFTVFGLQNSNNYNFTVRAKDAADNSSPFSNQVTGQALLNGLNYKYYTFTGTWNSLPDFGTLTPAAMGVMPNIALTPRTQDDNFAFLWEGYINITTSGTYYFRTNSDDGSRLWLGERNGAGSPYSFSGTPLVNNDGLHGTQNVTSSGISLSVGVYPIAIAFYEQGGGEAMTVSWRRPGTTSYATIPNSAFADAPDVNGSAPAAPSGVQATTVSYNRIDVNWNDNSNNENGFEIWRSTNAGSGYNTVGMVTAGVTSFVDSTLEANTTYYYKVRAIGQYGESALVPANPNATGLEASWGLNNNYTDASGNGKTLSQSNSPTFDAADKKEGTHAVNLNGSSQYLTIPVSGSFLQNSYTQKTVAFWMKSSNNTGNRVIVDIGGSDDGLCLALNSSRLYAGVANGSTRRNISVAYTSTAWNHVALVYSINTLKLYVNGVEVANNNSLGFNSVGTTSSGSRLGYADNANALAVSAARFSGKLDDVEIYNVALSEADVNNVMNGLPFAKPYATTAVLPALPAAPSAMTATASSISSISLNWNDNANNETSYELYRSGNNNSNYVLLATLAPNASSYVDTGLFANSVFYYKVRAINAGGNSAYANEVNATTPSVKPVITKIGNFAVKYGTVKTLTITATDADGDPLTLAAVNLPTAFATFTDNGNKSGTLQLSPSVANQGNFTMSVIAADPNGQKDTTTFTITVNNNSNPALTTISNVTLNEGASSSVNITAADADGNNTVTLAGVNLPSFVTVTDNGNGNGVLNIAPGYADAGTYTVKVKATDNSTGADSVSFNIVVNDKNPNQKIQVNMMYSSAGPAGWNNMNTYAKSNLLDVTGAATPVAATLSTTWFNPWYEGTTTGNNSGVYPDAVMQDYYYFGIYGAPETVDLTISGLDPAKTYNFKFFGSSKWTGVPDNGSTVYAINGNSIALNVQNNTTRTADFNGITPNASGNVVVNMSKAPGTPLGYLNAFEIESIFNDGTAPVAPKDVTAAINPGQGVKLSWNDVAYNETGYEVYRATTENGTYTVLNAGASNANAVSYTDNTAAGGTQYFYKLKAVNGVGASAFSDIASIATSNNNPVLNNLTSVTLKSGSTATVTITATDDATDALTLDVSNLPGFATLTNGVNGNATISLTPGANDIGVYRNITVKLSDDKGGSVTKQFDITVSDKNTTGVYVNFGADNSPVAPAPWNNVFGYPYAAKVVNGLLDESRNNSGIGITFVDGWDGTYNGGMITGNNSGAYIDDVLKSSIYTTVAGARTIKLTGLNTAKRYNLALYAGNNGGFASVSTYASGAQSTTLSATYNANAVAQLNNLTPNAAGEITFTVTKQSGSDYIYLNAMVIEAFDAAQVTIMNPINLSAEPLSKTSVKLTWNDRASNETGYEIWRSTSLNGTYTRITTTAANVTTLTNTGLTRNTKYYYKVRAVATGLQSDYTNTVSAITMDKMSYLNLTWHYIAGSPWNNTATNPQIGDRYALTDDESNGTGVGVNVVENFNGEFFAGVTTGNDSGIFPDNVMISSYWVDNGQRARFKVDNLNQAKKYRIGFFGSSTWFGDFTVQYTIGDRSVYLNSYMNASKAVYIDDVKPNADGEVILDLKALGQYGFTGAIMIQSYDDPSDVPPSIFTPGSTAANGFASGEQVTNMVPSVEAASMTDRQAATDETTVVATEVKAFPNPFVDVINLDISKTKASNVTVQLFDMMGRLVKQENLGNLPAGRTVRQLYLGNASLNDGMYILKLNVEGENVKQITLLKAKR